MKVHHIGYLVKKMEKAEEAFLSLGYERLGEMTRDESRGVDILFLQKDGYVAELVSPYTKDSIVSGLIRTYKNSPYHFCYESGEFSADMERLEAEGYLRMGEPAPAPAIGGRRVVFFMHPAIGMLELLEG